MCRDNFEDRECSNFKIFNLNIPFLQSYLISKGAVFIWHSYLAPHSVKFTKAASVSVILTLVLKQTIDISIEGLGCRNVRIVPVSNLVRFCNSKTLDFL